MTFPLIITAWTTLAVGALFLVLTWGVISVRRVNGLPFGDGENRGLMKRIRGHSNAAEQIPIFLIILGLAEAMGAAPYALISVAALFVAGRISHGVYFLKDGLTWRFRFWGMLATLISQALILLCLAAALFS